MSRTTAFELFNQTLSTTFLDHGFNESFDLTNELTKMYNDNDVRKYQAKIPIKENLSAQNKQYCGSICPENHQAAFICHESHKHTSECLLCSPTLSLVSTNYTEEEIFTSDNYGSNNQSKISEKKSSQAKKSCNPALNTDDLKKIWTERDFENLMEMAIRFRHNWKKIAKIILESTNVKPNPQALKRIHEKLVANKETKRVKFTHKDDLMIVKYYHMYGIDWSKIASHFEGKNQVMIKNRFYSYIKKRGMIENFSNEADCLEEEIEMPKAEDDSRVQQIKNILTQEEEETNYFAKPFFGDFGFDQQESELHDRVTHMSYQADSELFMPHFSYSERQDPYY